jgi:protein-tyrosine phosphatase
VNARSPFKRVYDALRYLPDRVLHHRRHFDAARRLSEMTRPRSILVVCHGNICRSPYLEAVLRRALPDLTVTSAGFVGPGRPVPPFSLAVSARRGLDLSEFRSRPLAPAKVREVDLVVVMDARQARYMSTHLRVAPWRILVAGDLDPMPGTTRAIEDPWRQPIEVYVAVFDRLDRCAATLVRYLPRPG